MQRQGNQKYTLKEKEEKATPKKGEGKVGKKIAKDRLSPID